MEFRPRVALVGPRETASDTVSWRYRRNKANASLRLRTRDEASGHQDLGDRPADRDRRVILVEDTFERYIAGQDPHDVETLFRRVYSAGFTQRPDVSMMGVFSGIEIAIWDILGKASELPVYKLIGGKFHDRIRTYTYIYPKSVSPDGNPGDDSGDVYHDGDAAAAHVSFSSPNFLILETIRTGFHDAILKNPLRWEQGYLIAPAEPGLGIELDERVVRDHPYATGGRLHLEMCQTPLGSNNSKRITELEG